MRMKEVIGSLIVLAFLGLCVWSIYYMIENAQWCRTSCAPYSLKMCGDGLAVCGDDSVRKR